MPEYDSTTTWASRLMVRLRQTTPADLGFVLRLEQDADNRPFIGQWTEEEHHEALSHPDTGHWIIEAAAGGRPIGYGILLGLSSPDRSISLKRLVIAEKGKGHGRRALQLLKRLVFEEMNAHRFWLDVKDHNTRARRLYESEGFVSEGILRECLKTGDAYESLVLMSILSHEYRHK